MYGSSVTVILENKIQGGILKLSRSVNHRHAFLKSGRGTIKTEITYHVYLDCRLEEIAVSDEHTFLSTNKKADANKIYKIIMKHGVETYRLILKGLAEDQHLLKKA